MKNTTLSTVLQVVPQPQDSFSENERNGQFPTGEKPVTKWFRCSYEHDLAAEIERIKPELIVINSLPEVSCEKGGYKLPLPQNYSAYPEIPRLGFLFSDLYSPTLYSNYRILNKLNCAAAFYRYAVPGECLFENSELPIFCALLPAKLKEFLYTDYSIDIEKKIIPLGLFGTGFFNDNNNHYPWRKAITKKLINKIPFFCGVRPSQAVKGSAVQGGDYYAMLNRCKISLTCGAEVNVFLNKHFEITLAGTCLATERTPVLEAIGFKDLVNCVFVDGNNVLDKLEYLYSNEDELLKITQAGKSHMQELFEKYNMYRMIDLWYKAYTALNPNEQVIQTDYFNFITTTKNNPEIPEIPCGQDTLKEKNIQGFALLRKNQINDAAKYFNDVLSYINYEPLARLGMSIVSIFSGNLENAYNFLMNNVIHIDKQYQFKYMYDPVDIAYLAIILLCAGKRNDSLKLLSTVNDIHYPALAAVRNIINNTKDQENTTVNSKSRNPVNDFTYEDWYQHFKTITEHFCPR